MKFKADLNLDDPHEVNQFITMFKTTRGRTLAKQLGFHGRGAIKAANALSDYARNKYTATQQRLNGSIATALQYEAICDRIYDRDIRNQIECW